MGVHRVTRAVVLLAIVVHIMPFGLGAGIALAQAGGNGVGTPFELSFWQSVSDSHDRAQLEAYLAQYPTGTFSGLARAKIAALHPSPPPVAAPVAAPVVVPQAQSVAASLSAAAPQSAPLQPAAAPSAPMSVPAVLVAATVATGTGSGIAPASAGTAPVAVVAVAQPIAQPTAATVPATAPVLSLLDQFAALGKSDMNSQPALFTETGPVPPRPTLAALTAVTIPDHFCSAVDRNSFHDSVYVPAVALADRNNEATIAHLKNVQALHGEAMAARNVPGANALAREATAFKPIADQSYQDRTAMTALFAQIMGVAVTGC